MNGFIGVVAVLLLSSGVHAATPIFLVGPGDPGAPPPDIDPDAYATRIEYQVVPNMRGIGENAVRDRPERFYLALPEHPGVIEFRQHRFEPIEGFLLDRDGTVRLDPKAPDAGIRYTLYGVGEDGEVLLVVNKG